MMASGARLSRAGHGRFTRSSWLAFVALTLVLSACGADSAPATGPTGSARFALELPDTGVIERVDYTVRISFLEASPPVVNLEESYSSVTFGGELIAILPCTTGADGDGLNQVDVSAKIWVRGRAEPFDASAAAVFTCVQNADTVVNLVLNVIAQLFGGFVDIDAMVGGTLCSSKVDMKADGYLGVCPRASCGGGEELLVFANECRAVQADVPTYWICGAPADWQVVGNRANAFFPVPEGNGAWTFGVIALDVFQMSQPDPSLTDAGGQVKVWAGLSAVRAYFERQAGETVRRENAPFNYEFAAELAVPPREAGQPITHLLLLVDQDVLGARVTWQRHFGACDVPASGVSLYPGLKALDLRRDGNQAARLVLGDAVTGYAISEARCETGWDLSTATPTPIITCQPPQPIR